MWTLLKLTGIGTSMYFLGDGFTHLSIDAAFLTYDLLAKNNRVLKQHQKLQKV